MCRFEGKYIRPRNVIERKIADLQAKRPGETIRIEQDSNLWPEMAEDSELAFDDKRIRTLAHWHQSRWELRVFDGQLAMLHSSNLAQGKEYYAVDHGLENILASPLVDLSWLRMAAHQLWFAKEKVTFEQRKQINGLPQDYTFLDQADYRGRRCYVLENRLARRQIHVGVDDRRLHGITHFVLPRSVDRLPAMRLAAGRQFASEAEVGPWTQELTEDEREQFQKRLKVEMFAFMRPWYEHFLDDYREVAPGFWIPAAQGYELRDAEAQNPQLEVRREMHLVDAKVNVPLADSLFTIKMADGVEVHDFDYNPHLVYQQKADRTPEEWREIVGDRRRRSEESDKN